MARKKERLVYDPLYRLKPAGVQVQTSRKGKTRVWTAVVRILSFGFAGK
jgi:hypothetical protein